MPHGRVFITMGGPQAHGHSMTVAARNGRIPSRDSHGAVFAQVRARNGVLSYCAYSRQIKSSRS